jgi:hypothetical protein
VVPVNSDEDDLGKRIIDLKRKRLAASVSQMEDQSEEEELFHESAEDSDYIVEPERKKTKNPGPTTRSHCGEGSSSKTEDYVPSSEDFSEDYVNDFHQMMMMIMKQ